MCSIAREGERGGRTLDAEWSPIIERRSHGFYAPVYSLFQGALSRTPTVGCQTWRTTAVISAPPSVGHAGNVFASSHLPYRSYRRRCYSVLRCPTYDRVIYLTSHVKSIPSPLSALPLNCKHSLVNFGGIFLRENVMEHWLPGRERLEMECLFEI